MKNKIIYITSIIVSLFVGVCGTLLVVYYIPDNNEDTKVVEEVVTINESDTIAPAVEKVYDSVVTVLNNDRSLQATGTGFVYKTDDEYGYILTNHHVIADARTIEVTNMQEVTVEATLLGSDEYADLAVLRVDKDFVLQVATLGDSTGMEIGDTVFAVGTPVDVKYYGTVTKGIISGINRTVNVTLDDGDDFMMEVLQTNTAINPGNSGGPLVNMQGEVIGINTLKLVEDEIEGMGFAIPIEMATSVLDKLESGQEIERPLLGVSMIDANNQYALFSYKVYLDKDYTKGVVVVDVENGSPAATAGFKKDDVILKIDDVEIEDSTHLRYILYKYSIGDTIKIEYERDGKAQTVEVKLTDAI